MGHKRQRDEVALPVAAQIVEQLRTLHREAPDVFAAVIQALADHGLIQRPRAFLP